MNRHTLNNGTEILELINGTEPTQGTKFIGQTLEGEFIIATIFNDNSYGWTTYGNSLAGVMNAYEFKHRTDNTEAHIERLDTALAECIDSIEGQDLSFEQEEILEQAHTLRGVIND